ncbi:MAG: GvpL/GvpF family gas vesicle protein, partial [Chloroflexi bacterium]|nr:GvpL/GvpF family gas vesicle protein [Chloroflexota bacterium]
FTNLGIGERGDIVHTIHFNNLAAVVSDSPIIEYDSSRRNMMAHTLVLEEVMKEFTILPVRFGTVATGEKAIREQVLKRRYGELVGLLAEMKGRIELGLKAFWYEGIIFEEIIKENPPIRRLRDSLMGRSVEESYYDRIRLGELIEKAMWEKRDEDAERILPRLRPLVYQARANKVITDRMVLNAAFLLEQKREAEFDQAVQQLGTEMGDRMMFKYVGPVPPYNFVNITISWDD